MRLNPIALALTAAILFGLTAMLATWWVLIFNTGGLTMRLIGNFYLGYSVSFIGSLIGLFWGLVQGFITGIIFGWLYNLFNKEKASD